MDGKLILSTRLKVKDIRKQMARVERHLVYAEKNEETLHWGQYGDLAQVSEMMNEIIVFLRNAPIAAGWAFVGNMSEADFWAGFEAQQHDHCHSGSRPDFACAHCRGAGWHNG